MADLIPVKSSNIEAIGYDPEAKELTVQFRGGNKYRYSEVTESDYQKFLTAESAGKHFHQHIRDKFKTERVKE